MAKMSSKVKHFFDGFKSSYDMYSLSVCYISTLTYLIKVSKLLAINSNFLFSVL